MKRTPDVFHELDKVIANYIGNPYCEIAIIEAQQITLAMSFSNFFFVSTFSY